MSETAQFESFDESPDLPVQIDSFVSKAFEPGDNPNNAWHHGGVLARQQELNNFLGPDAYYRRDAATPYQWLTDPTRRSTEGDMVPALIYDEMLYEGGDWGDWSRLSADQNMQKILEEQGIDVAETLVVSVGSPNIGIYHKLKEQGKIAVHETGWQKALGYDTMFALSSELEAIVGRAADCNMFEFWAPVPDGTRVAVDVSPAAHGREDPAGDVLMGLTHLGRTTMEGDAVSSFGEGRNMSFLAASLVTASREYGIPLSAFHVKQIAGIDQLDYSFTEGVEPVSGPDLALMHRWIKDFDVDSWASQGLLRNMTNPAWKPGDAIVPTDKWEAKLTAQQNMDFKFKGWFDQGMLRNLTFEREAGRLWTRDDPISPEDEWVAAYAEMAAHIALELVKLGVLPENIDLSHRINTGDVNSGYSSNAAAKDHKRPGWRRRPGTRDAYGVRRVKRPSKGSESVLDASDSTRTAHDVQ